MEQNLHEQDRHKKQMQTLYFIIGGLLLALIIQYVLFINKVNSIKKENRTVITQEKENDRALYSSAPRAARYPGSYQAPNFSHMASSFHSMFEEDPLMAMERVQERFNRMFNTARVFAPMMMQQFAPDLTSDFLPAVDIEETDKSYVVRCDIPGLEKDKINITTRNGMLTIQGTRENKVEKEDDKAGYYTVERSYGTFSRTIPLPGPVDETKIKAAYKDGVLSVELPKTGDSNDPSGKRIPVQ